MGIFLLCAGRGWRLRTTWVPRAENQAADDASKLVDAHCYSIARPQLDALCTRWQMPTLDVMAAAWSRIAPMGNVIPFCSRYACPGSRGDAFATSWATPLASDLLWIFPPPHLLHRVLRRCATAGSRAVIVVPRHSRAAWFSWITSGTSIALDTSAPWVTDVGPPLPPSSIVPATCTARAGSTPAPVGVTFLPVLVDFSAHRSVDDWC